MDEMVKQILELTPPGLLVLFLNLIAFYLHKTPLQKWTIPLIAMLLGAVLYPAIADVAKVSFTLRHPTVFNALIGSVIGGCAVCPALAVMHRFYAMFKIPKRFRRRT